MPPYSGAAPCKRGAQWAHVMQQTHKKASGVYGLMRPPSCRVHRMKMNDGGIESSEAEGAKGGGAGVRGERTRLGAQVGAAREPAVFSLGDAGDNVRRVAVEKYHGLQPARELTLEVCAPQEWRPQMWSQT